MTREKMIELAKKHANPEKRRWLHVGKVDSYGSEGNRIEVWALEGSPVRGYIIANREWVARLDGDAKRIKVFRELDDYR